MKKVIILIAAIIAATTVLNAQDYKKEGNVYSQVKKDSSKEEKTGFTYKDSKDNTYDIYIGKSGACYIKKVSKKTGNEYKQYLGEEISKDICKALNREYTSKSSK